MRRPTPGQFLLIIIGIVIAIYGIRAIVIALRSDQTRVRMVLHDVEEYARTMDPGGVLEYLDPGYRDPTGRSIDEVRAGVRFLLLRAQSVEAALEPLSIEVEGDTATAIVRARGVVNLQGQTVTLADGGYRGDVFEVKLKRYGSYFRATAMRPTEWTGGDPE